MKICVIVDGFSAGKLYANEFKQKGFQCVHIKTRHEPFKTGSKFTPSDYIECITHDGNINNTLSKLKKYDIACVIAGSEPGVILADTLSESLNLITTNGSRMSLARRNKFYMADALREKKIKTALFYKSNNVDNLLKWIDENTTWPVVIKSLDSTGTDGIFICSSADEVRSGFKKIINDENYIGQINREVLVQSFLKGVEYVVNLVSCHGQHFVNDIWQYRKKFIKGHGNIYDRDELLPFEGEIQSLLISYTKQVLDALDIKYGPSHAEIILTDEGPILVEVGARLSGATNIEVSNECVGHNAVQLSVNSYVDQDEFFRLVNLPLNMRKYAMIIDLFSEREGFVQAVSIAEDVKSLPSLRSCFVRIKPGDRIKLTKDLFSSPAHFQIVHESRNQLEIDYKFIQEMALSSITLSRRPPKLIVI